MNRTLATISILLFSVLAAGGQTKPPDKRLMTETDYKAFLLQVDTLLPKMETEFKNIDLEKFPQLSYSRGKSMADQQTLGLMEVGYSRDFVARQRKKHTVSGELALKGFLDSLSSVGEEMLWEEDWNGITVTRLQKYGPELSALLMQISNDVNGRVDLLESGSCPRTAP